MNIPAPGEKLRVIITGEPEMQLRAFREWFTEWGFTPIITKLDALEVQVDMAQPHLYVFHLDFEDFWQLDHLRMVKKKAGFYTIPIIVLSPNDTMRAKIRAFDAGANEYIIMPTNPHELKVRADSLMVQSMQNNRMMRLFSQFISSDLLHNILESEGDISLSGERRNIVSMFGDLRGFTAFSSHRDAMETVTILNSFLTIMTDAVLDHGGFLNKFLGDGFFAFWGAPVSRPDDCLQAANCAKEIRRRIDELNSSREIPLRIGAATGMTYGEAVVGNIGTKNHVEYTAIGSCVNLSSRLTGVALESEILVDSPMRDQLEDNFSFFSKPPVKVKGFDEPVPIHTLGDDLLSMED